MVQTRKTNILRPRAPPASKTAAPVKTAKATTKAIKPRAGKEKPKKIGDYTTFKLPNKKIAIGEIVSIEKNGAYVVELLTEEKIMGKGEKKKAKKVGDYTVMTVGKGKTAKR
jgi:hypothetical protein